MKKGLIIISVILLSLSLFWLGFGYHRNEEPNTFYQVFLDGELIGTVTSRSKLERYIDAQNEYLKKKYNVNTIYSPNGLEIERIVTYNGKIDEISDVYEKIKSKKAFTIKGYQMTIKNDNDEPAEILYAVNTNVFSDALQLVINTFTGTENYQNYINKKQKEITTTGTIIENVYISNSKTLKETYISTNEKIYTDSTELSKYLIFGEDVEHRDYTVKLGDTIENVAFNNKISVEELLLSNEDITSAKNLLFIGQALKIAETSPKLKVVVNEYVIEDVVNKFATIEEYDNTLAIGNNKVIQNGENGQDRVSKHVERTNGTITYVNTESKIELKPTLNKIIAIGQKVIPNVGSTDNWAWPTNSGWTISSGFEWRINPINGYRELHDALDIAGTGEGSPIYAANHGVVEATSYTYINGNYVVINHNNGYYSYYGHMSRIWVQVGQTVARGEQIGQVGHTGWATGPHVHFAIFVGFPYRSGSRAINPWYFYNK